MDLLNSWALPVLAVVALGGATLALALLVGCWIDSYINSVVYETLCPR